MFKNLFKKNVNVNYHTTQELEASYQFKTYFNEANKFFVQSYYECSPVAIATNLVADAIANLQKLHTDNTLEVVFEKPVSLKQLAILANEKSIQAVSETTYLFTTNDSDSLRKKIMQWSIQEDINIASMQVASSSLETVFRKLTK